jgi:RecA-family ATPase
MSIFESELPGEVNAAAECLTVPFSEIPAIPATELWPGVIPNRTPVFLVAPGGTGKGLAIAAIAALVTTGRPFPGEKQGSEPGQVIIVAPEDDPNEDMAFRLTAAGADLSLVLDLTVLPDGSQFLLPGDIPELQRAITEANEKGPPVKLVALDPLAAMAENGLGSVRNARGIISPLQDVCRDYGGAMILSHHTTKDGKVVAGSKALTDSARLVWMIAVAPDDADARVMTPWKSNRAATEKVRYRIEGDGASVRAVFTGPETAVQGSRAARLRLNEATPATPAAAAAVPLDSQEGPADMARKWLASHQETSERETA